MKAKMNKKKWFFALAAGTAVTFTGITDLSASLVFEEDLIGSDYSRQQMDREKNSLLSDVLQNSERLQRISVGPASVREEERMSQSEMVRRKRMRQELQNEDYIQVRLEEERLSDEERRAKRLFRDSEKGERDLYLSSRDQISIRQAQVYAENRQEQLVQPSVLDEPGRQSLAVGQAAQSQMKISNSSSETQVSVRAYGGIMDMKDPSHFEVKPQFATGIGLGVSVSDHLSVEAGYTYGAYGVELISTSALVQNMQWADGNAEPLTLNQNIFDLGLKMHVLGPDVKLRPFLGAGAGYSRSFLNYTPQYREGLKQLGRQAKDYETSSYLGHLSSGVDISLAPSVTLGAAFKYYTVLSSRQNQNLNMMGFNNMNYYDMWHNEDDKRYVGSSIADKSFYSVMGTVSFAF
jgi:outer membrane protein W